MMNNSAEQRNFFEFSRDFIMSHIDTITDNINACREQPNRKEIDSCYLRIAGSAAVLLVTFGVAIFLLYYAFTLVGMGINFLRANEPLGVIVGSLVLIYVLALIINSFMKKPKGKTEREQDAEKMKLGQDLLKAFQDLAPKYAIERPDGISDMSNFTLDPCELVENIYIYIFTLEKDASSDKPCDIQRLKRSLIRRLKRLERMNELSTPLPYGFIFNDDELCSILVFDIIDNGDYISIRVARADEDSYALWKRYGNGGSACAVPADPDF